MAALLSSWSRIARPLGDNFGLGNIIARGGFHKLYAASKSFTGPTGLEEVVGHFGMGLKLAVENQTLLFISQTYFLKAFGKRLPLPRFLSPGKMIIGHEDLGAGRFHFTLKLTHPLFGTLIDQCVAFQDCTR